MKKFTWLIVAIVVLGAGIAGYALRGTQNSTNSTEQTSGQTSGSKAADYAGKGLSSFPKEVLKDTKLTSLDLSNNNLTGALPAEIKNLQNLVTLDVSNNQMTGIPAEIGQLKKLRVLNYANNQITGLPMELGNLTQLQVLDLSGNNPSQQDLAKIRAKLTNTDIKL